MIDHLMGRPSPSWRRTQVIIFLLFWLWKLRSGDPRGPVGFKRLNDRFRRYTPWQIAAAILTCLYGLRHWDIILGLAAPEPLARLYSRGFYRATWINTALDAGFATASSIPVKWLRDVLSVMFSGYYLLYASEADEKLRKFRAIPTVEILRVTWEKTTNPIIRFVTRPNRPSIPIKRKYTFPRPPGSKYSKPITCWLYFSRPDVDLVRSKNLILDVPGGGFIAMSPLNHEERLIRWAVRTGIPILSIDYCKAPEYPFPYAIHECMDVYRLIHESKGRAIGMGMDHVDVVLSGDSAGANISAAMINCMLESPQGSPFCTLPLPIGLIWMYPALDFNFTSWMSPENLRILRRDESSAELPEGILEAKNHLQHKSPLSVVDDRADQESTGIRGHQRKKSNLRNSFVNLPSVVANTWRAFTPKVERNLSEVELKLESQELKKTDSQRSDTDEDVSNSDLEATSHALNQDKSLSERVMFHEDESPDPTLSIENGEEGSAACEKTAEEDVEQNASSSRSRSKKKVFGTHLTMTSRTGFFNDRIISPSMMRCMAICYIGPRNAPDLTKDYQISPIFTPSNLLSQYPPVYLVCGEKDPFVDDTVIMAGKIREAKQKRKLEAIVAVRKRAQVVGPGYQNVQDRILEETEADWVQMRIFEGWSHGFAQMLPLLPEVGGALDLMADFILSAFRKHDSKNNHECLVPPAPQLGSRNSSNFQRQMSRENSPSFGKKFDEDEALTFRPRGRARGDSGSVVGSPTPSFLRLGKRVNGSPSSNSLRSTPPPLLVSRPDSGKESVTAEDKVLLSAGAPMTTTPKSMIEYNATSAAAIVTPPVVTLSPASEVLVPKEEGKILDDHLDLLTRRREEAGYGLSEVQTPEDIFPPMTEFSGVGFTTLDGRNSEDELRSQYVGELDLLERRRLDATYGLTQANQEHSSSNKNDDET
ncbi:Alpha/Beta hydrolase protein [Phakopsora pachyrhizi]|uniref:Alpha/Beta hydrolase protein n=1 Tax=Phakopsora pachyrhizi TaxID=170000 RepID=A0AAV0BT23_PHAPC|nr:Alpha/Beta hydrolase protein [Phakopsora pachyrhizi]CAH7689376.1 Alpha/Beta hydrolase protein [Phakopsora pachyrhizi]